ncbi:TS1R3 protein, partial [Columbina picui]|nr:TS1R3 protein [Columbina picui]
IMVPELLLCLSFAYAAAPKPTCLSAQLQKPGDYILGGLFPFGMDAGDLAARSEPTAVLCERLSAEGLIWALGMKFAVDQINSSPELLPGVALGYDLWDTCSEPLVALQPTLLFLTQNGTTGIGVRCNYSDYQPRVTAVIGPHSSDLGLVTAKLLGSFLIPQVSYGASSERLSNTESFPSFYRTVPGDKSLVEAVVLLLNEFGWNWVGSIGSDDEYGRGAQGLFLSVAGNHSICVAFEGLIPTDLADPRAQNQLEDTIQTINKTKVNIIVLFAFSQPAQALLEHSIRMGLSEKVWIGTEAWLLSDIPASIPNIQSIGTVLGFVMKAGAVPGFQKYVADLFTSVQQDEFCQESRDPSGPGSPERLHTRCKQCDRVSLRDVSAVLSHWGVRAVHSAVHSVAAALHRALGCARTACPRAPVRPWQVSGQRLRFDQSHSINTGYELIFWSWKNGTLTYQPVGDYGDSLSINKSWIQFHTTDQKEPTSECFSHCEPGQFRQIKGSQLCCYDCTDCPENTFLSTEDSPSCTRCPQHQWAPARSTLCHDRGQRYLFWDEPLAMALLLLMALSAALSCTAAGLFYQNLGTPLVQASGGKRSLFALFSLLLLSLSCCLYIGKPNNSVCAMQQMAYALCLNGCFSTFVVKSLEIALGRESPRCAPTLLRWVTRSRAWLLVALCLLTQGLFCCFYLRLGPDCSVSDSVSLPREVLRVCRTRSWAAFALLHGYNGCLALGCLLCTFMVQTAGGTYNMARGITFATLSYFIIWIFFIAFFATLKTVLRAVTQIGTVLATSLGILGTYYIPKCYILLFKPDLNTVDYFQNSIEEQPEQDSQ